MFFNFVLGFCVLEKKKNGRVVFFVFFLDLCYLFVRTYLVIGYSKS